MGYTPANLLVGNVAVPRCCPWLIGLLIGRGLPPVPWWQPFRKMAV